MVDSWTQGIYDIDYVNFDLFIFIHMEGIFYTHLMAITGGQPIPRSVYYSSWVSNTKLESYIAAHRSEENDDNENGSDEKQPASTTSATTTTTTSRSTTTATIKAKLGYLPATTVLLITVYQEIETKYMDYICYYSSDSLDPYFVPTTDDLTPNPNYPAYCFSTLSTFETTLLQHFPSLDNYLYSFYRISFTRLSALCFALAWSTIPTTVVVTAWIQMWNSLSSSHKIRKVHYVVFMYPLKMAALGLVMYYTLDRREYVESADYMGSSSDGVRAKYLLVWFVLFRAATKLAFGLGLIWNLYVVHSKDATADRIHHSHQEEKKEMEQVV